jgi:hypothetical protein
MKKRTKSPVIHMTWGQLKTAIIQEYEKTETGRAKLAKSRVGESCVPVPKKATKRIGKNRDERAEIIEQFGHYIVERSLRDETVGVVNVKGKPYYSLGHVVDFIYADRHKEL